LPFSPAARRVPLLGERRRQQGAVLGAQLAQALAGAGGFVEVGQLLPGGGLAGVEQDRAAEVFLGGRIVPRLHRAEPQQVVRARHLIILGQRRFAALRRGGGGARAQLGLAGEQVRARRLGIGGVQLAQARASGGGVARRQLARRLREGGRERG